METEIQTQPQTEEEMKAENKYNTKADTKVVHSNINNLAVGVQMDQEVKITIKYVRITFPPNTNPSYDVSAIDIDK